MFALRWKHCVKWWSHQPGLDAFTSGTWVSQPSVLWVCGAGLNWTRRVRPWLVSNARVCVWQNIQCYPTYYTIFRFCHWVMWSVLVATHPNYCLMSIMEKLRCMVKPEMILVALGVLQPHWHVHWIAGMETFLFQSEYLIPIIFSGDWTHFESDA